MLDMKNLLDGGYKITLRVNHEQRGGGYLAVVISDADGDTPYRRRSASGATPGMAVWNAMRRSGWDLGAYPGDSDAEQVAALVHSLRVQVELVKAIYEEAFQRGRESVISKPSPTPTRKTRSRAHLKLV